MRKKSTGGNQELIDALDLAFALNALPRFDGAACRLAFSCAIECAHVIVDAWGTDALPPIVNKCSDPDSAAEILRDAGLWSED